jgi:hypothetical protein
LVFSPIPTTIEQVRAGKLRALAVTTPTRSPALPNAPTIGEFVAGYEASVWNGVVAPKDTPAAIIDKLHEAIDAALADPKLMTQFAGIGSVPKVDDACRFWQVHCRRHREVGKGDPRGQHQAGMIGAVEIFHNLPFSEWRQSE